jgi:hypothetical protein
MGIRTPDLLIANETLYQLSYTPNMIDFSELHDNRRSKNATCLYQYKRMEPKGIEAPPSAAPTNFFELLRMSLV